MNTLIVATFNGLERAETARRDILSAYGKETVAPEEAAVVTVEAAGEVSLHHTTRLTAPAALGGGFVGILAGLLVFNPALALVGGISGTALGGILGALKEVGVEESLMKELAAQLRPGSSALFIRGRRKDLEKVARRLASAADHVFRVSLAHGDTDRLQAVLREMQAPQQD